MTIGEQQKLAVLKSHVKRLKEAVDKGSIQDDGLIASLEGIIALFETQSKNIQDLQVQINQAKRMARGGLFR